MIPYVISQNWHFCLTFREEEKGFLFVIKIFFSQSTIDLDMHLLPSCPWEWFAVSAKQHPVYWQFENLFTYNEDRNFCKQK